MQGLQHELQARAVQSVQNEKRCKHSILYNPQQYLDTLKWEGAKSIKKKVSISGEKRNAIAYITLRLQEYVFMAHFCTSMSTECSFRGILEILPKSDFRKLQKLAFFFGMGNSWLRLKIEILPAEHLGDILWEQISKNFRLISEKSIMCLPLFLLKLKY